MSTFGVDYAFAPHPSVSALKAAGAKFAARYLSPYASKNLSKSEAASLRAAGIAVVVVWEWGAQRAESGKAAGVADAKSADALVKSIGMPSNQVIYFAVDYDTTVGPHITGYFQGVASVIGKARTGVYGGYKVVKGCFDAGLVTFGWQTYAWSGGKWDGRAQIQQYSNGHTIGSGSVDYDRAMVAHYGQWAAAGSGSTSSPPKSSGSLTVDGELGPKTIKALQKSLGVTQDGEIGPKTIKALQKHLGVTADGVMGPKTIKALQKRLGVTQDGELGPKTIKALQKRLNAGTF